MKYTLVTFRSHGSWIVVRHCLATGQNERWSLASFPTYEEARQWCASPSAAKHRD